jgi:hypothetical protein
MERQCNNCKSLWKDDIRVHCRTNKISESKQACGWRRRGTCDNSSGEYYTHALYEKPSSYLLDSSCQFMVLMLNNQIFLMHCLNHQILLRIVKDLQSIHSVLQKKISHLVSSWTSILSNMQVLSNIFVVSSTPENYEIKIEYSELV